MDKYVIELADMIKNSSNEHASTAVTSYDSFIVGVVETAPPNLQIRTDPEVLLKPNQLVIASHLLSGYERTCTINGATSTSIQYLNDAIQKGDRVILVPSHCLQTYLVIDKAVTL